jgi:hypothetical protein
MKSFVRRLIKLEQHLATVPIALPPLPPPDASKEELECAMHEALQQLYAHPHQQGWFFHLSQICQRFGVNSQKGMELFYDGVE